MISSRNATLALLAAALLVGGVLRTWGVNRQGALGGDEATYVLVSQTLVEPLVWVAAQMTGRTTESLGAHMMAFMGPPGRHAGYPPGEKPGYYPLVIAAAAFVGFTPSATALVAVVCGLVSLLLVWRIAVASNNSAIALAALLLALSPYHVLYSRTGLANIPASMFLLLGALFMVRSWNAAPAREVRFLAAAGLSLGYAFMVHSVVLPQIGLLVLADTADLRRRRDQPYLLATLRRAGWVTVGIVVPIAFVEVFTWVFLAAKTHWLPSVTWGQTFLSSVAAKILADAAGRGTPRPAFQLAMLHTLEGAPAMALAAVGSVVCIRRFDRPLYRMIGLQAWVPLTLWSLTGLQVTRAFAVVMPFWAMLVALGIVAVADAVYRWAPSWRPAAPMAIVALVVLIAVSQWPALRAVTSLRSGYEPAVSFVIDRGARRHLSTQRPPSQLHAGIPNVPPLPADASLEALFAFSSRENLRYLLVDVEEVIYPSVALVRARCTPVTSVPNPVFEFWPMLADQLEGQDLREGMRYRDSRGRIDIFDLTACLHPATQPPAMAGGASGSTQ